MRALKATQAVLTRAMVAVAAGLNSRRRPAPLS